MKDKKSQLKAEFARELIKLATDQAAETKGVAQDALDNTVGDTGLNVNITLNVDNSTFQIGDRTSNRRLIVSDSDLDLESLIHELQIKKKGGIRQFDVLLNDNLTHIPGPISHKRPSMYGKPKHRLGVG